MSKRAPGSDAAATPRCSSLGPAVSEVTPLVKKLRMLGEATATVPNGSAEVQSNGSLAMADGHTGAQGVIDEDLHSRQLAVYGRDGMRRMACASILVCGLNGLGVEVAKNIILAGVRAVTLQDQKQVTQSDLSAQFYLTESDIGQNRAECCRDKLQQLNTAVDVRTSASDLTQELISQFQVVVCTDVSLREAVPLDKLCHSQNPPIAFIRGETRGVFASVFCDFGPQFTVLDVDGEEPHTCIIASITAGATTLVNCVEDERLGFQDGDLVAFSEVEGMDELNAHRPVKVKNCKATSFEVELDSSSFAPFARGGLVVQVKERKIVEFNLLEKELQEPGQFLLSDFSKMERSATLHIAFQALDRFQQDQGRLPLFSSKEDANRLLEVAKQINEAASSKAELEEDVVRKLASNACSELNPLAAMFGGIVGQEVVKAISSKFHPLHQWFYFDSIESLPKEALSEAETQPVGSRYDPQIAIFGKTFQEKLGSLDIFLVGAGALGCEFLKNFAMMGIASTSGVCTVTDDDIIERSNLSRQFLFRDWSIGKAKSSVAAQAAQELNPDMKIKALQNRVSPETESIFNDHFWQKLDLVVNALDNVNARLYVDSRCLYYCRPLLESGTLGPKCNTQMVIPRLTENYGASRDPPEKQAPMCTVHSFPHNIDHCLTWARSEFEGLLEKNPAEANLYLSAPAKYADNVKSSIDAAARERLLRVAEVLARERSTTFEECIEWARRKFEDYFHDRIAQLVYTFPEDAVTSTGLPFWSAPKRFPTPLFFDVADPIHVMFVQSAAILKAEVYGVKLPIWAKDIIKVAEAAAAIPLPEFVPRKGVKIETDPKAKDSGLRSGAMDEDGMVDELLQELSSTRQHIAPEYRLTPISFEKDDDSNYHMDMITALSNLRARNYHLQEVDKLKAKLIAGRIIPAVATATAVATGLVCLELYKVLHKDVLESYRNTFCNLAVPLFAMAEPVSAKSLKYKDLEWSLWDRWVLQGDLTVQEVLDWFEAKSLHPYSISCGPSLLYNNIFPKHKERLNKRMSELVHTVAKQELPAWRNCFDIVVACEDDEGEDLDVPLVSIKFR